MYHDPPLLFNVDADPAEQYPVASTVAPAGILSEIIKASGEFDRELTHKRIRF